MDKDLLTVVKMKKSFKCTLSHCEDCDRECAGCNFWATLSTTDLFKGILGRSPETGEDRKCLKRLTTAAPHSVAPIHFHVVTHGCLQLREVGRKDNPVLVLQRGSMVGKVQTSM